jgi:hypothetical protein
MKPSKAAKEKNPNPAQPTRVKKSLRLQMPLLLSAAIVSSLRTHGQLIRKLQHQAMHQQKLRHGMAAYSNQENKHCHRIIERPKRRVWPIGRMTRQNASVLWNPGIPAKHQPSVFANGIGLAQLRKTEKSERR